MHNDYLRMAKILYTFLSGRPYAQNHDEQKNKEKYTVVFVDFGTVLTFIMC